MNAATLGNAMQIKVPGPTAKARRIALIKAAQATIISVVLSELATLAISTVFHLGADLPAYLIAAILPVCLAAPGSYFQFIRHEQLKDAYRQLDLLASTDWLTQCLNRRAFTNAAMAKTASGRPGALLVIDADSFKTVNDRFGHDMGDEALQRIAQVIRQSVREGDLVGRLGGEEFGIFLADAAPDLVQQIAERIREDVMDIPFTPGAAPHQLSVSVGVAICEMTAPFAELFRLADQQLYAAKQSGRNRVVVAPMDAASGSLAAA